MKNRSIKVHYYSTGLCVYMHLHLHNVIMTLLILPQLEDDEFKDPPTEEDITISIQALRNRRAPGTDGIPTEIFKSGG
jgi:hypothetical protein